MPNYSTNLRLTKPITGEFPNTWGDQVNAGITELVDSAIAGYASIAMTDADYTLTFANGAADQARTMMLNMTGTLTANRNVICPTGVTKLYFVKNATTGGSGYAITLKYPSGSGVSIPNGRSMVLMCDGTNVREAVDFTTTINATNLAYTGTLTGGTGIVNLGSGQFYKDASGNVGVGVPNPAAYPGGKMVVAATGEVNSWVLSDVASNTSLRGLALGIIGYNQILGAFRMNVQSGELRVQVGYATYGGFATFYTNGLERMRLDSSGNQINTPSNTPPTLTVNGQMNLTPTSNTNMRISYRGSDGVTRVANITLA